MDECQKYDCLYNKFSKDFKNTKIRTNCWKKRAEKFKISQQEANKKYKYIRSSFVRYLRKKKATKSDKNNEAFIYFKHNVWKLKRYHLWGRIWNKMK